MIKALEKRIVHWILALGVAAISLYITPAYSNDPINVPKMFLLILTGFLAFGFVLANLKMLYIQNKYATSLLAIFVLDLVIVLLTSGAPLTQQLYGVNGRSTGFYSYLALALLLITGILVSDFNLTKLFSISLLICGVVSTFYGLLQAYGHDPVKWNNPYSSVISFLGNPDFASSFIALSSALAIALIFATRTKIRWRLLLIVYLLIAGFTIIKSHAQQGVLVLVLVSGVTFYIFLLKTPKFSKVWSKVFAAVSALIGIIGILGIFKIGPLSEVLYKVSVRQRGFYWHAAFEMMKAHPFTGIGIDSYGDWYLQKRSANAAFFSLTTQSNTAHNVYLDLASNGGFPLLIISLLLTALVFWRSVKYLRQADKFDPYFVAIFTAWLGYQAQSIVSINQLGIAAWGWAFSGILIGYPFTSRTISSANSPEKSTKVRRAKSRRINWAAPLISALIGGFIAFPPYLADHQYRIAAATRDGNKVLASIKDYPESTGRTLQAASAFASSKLYPQALDLAKHVIDINPREYNAWLLISQITAPNDPTHLKAASKLRYLNPHDKTIR